MAGAACYHSSHMLVELNAMDPIHIIAHTVVEPANVHHILDYSKEEEPPPMKQANVS
jgi:hypothetical protein